MRGFCIIALYSKQRENSMKHDMITTRLKGLIDNFGKAIQKDIMKHSYSERSFASNIYQVKLDSNDGFDWIFSFIFRTESINSVILPIDEQKVSFSLKRETFHNGVLTHNQGAFLDINEARNLLKNANKKILELGLVKGQDNASLLGQLKDILLNDLINETPSLRQHNEKEFVDFADHLEPAVLESRDLFWNAKDDYKKSIEQAGKEIDESEEYLLVKDLRKKLDVAHVNLSKKRQDIFAEYKIKEKEDTVKATESFLDNHIQSFYSSCLNKLRTLELPLSLFKKYKPATSKNRTK